jgi:O-acetyl-ADP-ribose deacetylase (regulator of RNase III)
MEVLMETRLGNADLKVVKGDITKLQVDAIVNAANRYLEMGGGVAGAIKKAGGAVIEREARVYAPINIGEAVSTSGGKLKARYVIHAPTMKTPGPTNRENVYLATLAALNCAARLGVSRIAIPGMGTGVGGMSYDDAAVSMRRAVLETSMNKALSELILIDIDDKMVKSFVKAFSQVSARQLI